MKTFVKWLIAGGVILCIGVIVMLCGLAANGWKWKITEDFVQKEYVAENTVTAYDINIAAGTVKVEFTDSDTVSVSYPESEHFGYNITEENGKLTVAYNKSVNFFFGWFIPANIPDTVIKVPYGIKANYDITVNAGKIVLAQGSYGNMNIRLNAGKVEAGEMTCAYFDCQVNAGAAALSSVDCPMLDVKVNAGSFTLNRSVCDRLTVNVNAGSAEIFRTTCPIISVDVSAGSAFIDVDGEKRQYNISVSKSAGSCNLTPQVGGDPNKRITVNLSAGSANIIIGD